MKKDVEFLNEAQLTVRGMLSMEAIEFPVYILLNSYSPNGAVILDEGTSRYTTNPKEIQRVQISDDRDVLQTNLAMYWHDYGFFIPRYFMQFNRFRGKYWSTYTITRMNDNEYEIRYKNSKNDEEVRRGRGFKMLLREHPIRDILYDQIDYSVLLDKYEQEIKQLTPVEFIEQSIHELEDNGLGLAYIRDDVPLPVLNAANQGHNMLRRGSILLLYNAQVDTLVERDLAHKIKCVKDFSNIELTNSNYVK